MFQNAGVAILSTTLIAARVQIRSGSFRLVAVVSAVFIAIGVRHHMKERSKHKKFPGVTWYCDNCGERIDTQEGFKDSLGSWRCTNCGYENSISSSDIFESHQDWFKTTREERRATPIVYPNNMTQQDFERVVRETASSIKRLSSVSVDGADVTGTVISNSGLTAWHFTIDFNDYGNVLGEIWISSENDDSIIPRAFAERIQTHLKEAEA